MVLNRGQLPTALPEIEDGENRHGHLRQRHRAIHAARSEAERMRHSQASGICTTQSNHVDAASLWRSPCAVERVGIIMPYA